MKRARLRVGLGEGVGSARRGRWRRRSALPPPRDRSRPRHPARREIRWRGSRSGSIRQIDRAGLLDARAEGPHRGQRQVDIAARADLAAGQRDLDRPAPQAAPPSAAAETYWLDSPPSISTRAAARSRPCPCTVTGGQPVDAIRVDAERAQRRRPAARSGACACARRHRPRPRPRPAPPPPSGSASRCRHCRGKAARRRAQMPAAVDDEAGRVRLLDRHAHLRAAPLP